RPTSCCNRSCSSLGPFTSTKPEVALDTMLLQELANFSVLAESSIVPELSSGRKNAQRRARLLRHHDCHLLLRRPASPVLSDNHDRMFAGLQRLRKVAERSVCADVGHRLSVYDQRRSRFRPPKNLRHAPMQLRPTHLQHHLLRLALDHDRKFERFA